jgi:hypothetical protein
MKHINLVDFVIFLVKNGFSEFLKVHILPLNRFRSISFDKLKINIIVFLIFESFLKYIDFLLAR